MCIDLAMHMHYYSSINLIPQEAVMAVTLEVESTLTDRYQTTVPETVRRALRLGKRWGGRRCCGPRLWHRGLRPRPWPGCSSRADLRSPQPVRGLPVVRPGQR